MHRPFEILDEWIREGRIRLSMEPAAEPEPNDGWSNGESRDIPIEPLPPGLSEEELFAFAMKDVRSLGWSAVPLHNRPPMEIQTQDDEQQALRALEEFVREGNVEIEQTAEYIEASVQPHGRLYLDDLRSGRFSVQAHLDLHGLTPADARFILEEFLLESVRSGFSCVRVIHGRGRHSRKHHPILKENVQRWLCTRRMGRHVIAYTSARWCDGGGGAVYVLLRN